MDYLSVMKYWYVLSLVTIVLICLGCGDSNSSFEITNDVYITEGGKVEVVSGPMIGHVSMRSISVWVQANRKCDLSLKVWNDELTEESDIVSAESRTANSAVLQVGGLYPGSEYSVVVQSNGKSIGDTLKVSTQVLWDYRMDPPAFKLIAGSCAFINDSLYDRPGKPYGDEYEIFESMADEDPDMMLWLGDNIYLREVDFQSYSGYLHRYTHTRSTPEMQRLLKSCPNYAIWDDHDFGPNDADRNWIHGDWASESFKAFWANPSYGAPAGANNVATAFRFSDVEFFLLDNRSNRVHHYNETQDPQVLGEDQIDWLIAAMNKSYAQFKVVAIGGQFLSDNASHENMARFPEREEIIDRIEEERIHGVVFISGDRHCTELSRLELAHGIVVHDLTTSPLTSSSYNNEQEINTLRVEGTVAAERNYAVMNFSGPRKDRTMEIIIKDVEGEEIWSRKIRSKEL